MPRTLQDWLSHLETAHSNGLIDMGLTRVSQVKHNMNLQPHCPIIVVGGTNGKGSVCAYLSQIYKQAGYRVGTLTSPHLLRFNERIALNTEAVSDEQIVAAFERIEAARGAISLTYFEFNTLAAVDIFIRENVDVMILEVGLGGRLDAVNIFDADCAIVTSIDLDHQAFLGDTIEQVGFEKAGIFRAQRPAICGQNPPPQSLQNHAAQIGAELLVIKQDFDFSRFEQQWSFQFTPRSGSLKLAQRNRNALPLPALRGSYQINNAACALAALECLNARLPVDLGAIKRGLLLVENKGRFQVLAGRPITVLDVGHNPHAAHALRQSLIALPFAQHRIAVFSILADKDIGGVLSCLKDQFDEWYIAPLHLPRGMTNDQLQQQLSQHHIQHVKSFDSIAQACQAALSAATENDRIVVFGSFHTVAEAMAVCK
ncbi:bifunctional tetrahydrofolate synthase/dihydrofolate synthase [Alysiella filiformis]|uniref:Dihydrofolate synthase/folylpolyglutamate synthase n=1 Tax=Alysiella filiformis DSM 16848 TaxID=1120981 RepID=A0A286EC56_9NEIS|nr:bifunctional tetrahydrofolate synthase/dihydrofolate synthase [Alysiella filiformis]QMT30616.1 bifunctional tetrahydrofolate synthase/dihydrofolate synthase [Alysiella filiformis]UBQ56406.1 bifunctional tetrahydrofolate synthase/dihydrofolate synthase [Alysiella filiformis DSM 16848]SOD68492.1 dihydrofolate synthase / folylpolyglutamate synthase [Alysiella filiformis DSM 16848]